MCSYLFLRVDGNIDATRPFFFVDCICIQQSRAFMSFDLRQFAHDWSISELPTLFHLLKHSTQYDFRILKDARGLNFDYWLTKLNDKLQFTSFPYLRSEGTSM